MVAAFAAPSKVQRVLLSRQKVDKPERRGSRSHRYSMMEFDAVNVDIGV